MSRAPGEAHEGGVVRVDADHVASTSDLAVHALQRVGRAQLRPVLGREAHEGEQVVFGSGEQARHLGGALLQRCRHAGRALTGLISVLGGEDLADGGGHERLLRLCTLAEHVPEEVHPQRCRGQPRTLAIALFRPSWASETQSCTPGRPRARRVIRNSRQKASVSASPTSMPITSRLPVSCRQDYDASVQSREHVGGLHLGFENPSDMTDAESESCVDLLIEQKPLVTTYWSELGKLK